jgi:CheY-like chemotaxis protein
MDLQMPVMDGLVATEQIRARHLGGDPWIIALTAGGLHSGRDATQKAGMNDHLYKPLKLEDLREALERAPVRVKG